MAGAKDGHRRPEGVKQHLFTGQLALAIVAHRRGRPFLGHRLCADVLAIRVDRADEHQALDPGKERGQVFGLGRQETDRVHDGLGVKRGDLVCVRAQVGPLALDEGHVQACRKGPLPPVVEGDLVPRRDGALGDAAGKVSRAADDE